MMESISERIARLKKEKDAVILAHYYAPAEVQDMADCLGDSLGLSRTAAGTGAKTIIFAGVHFMAETAAILCPGKTVLSPAPDAGCSLADSMDAAVLERWKAAHPDGIVVSYVNTTAAVKAWTDWCCTSANAIKVVQSLPEGRPVLFGPDRNLGSHIMKATGRKLELWEGVCTVHDVITPEMIRKAAEEYPDADILVHPEAACSADGETLGMENVYFYSTAGMLRHVAGSSRGKFVIATETGTIHRLSIENPGKTFIPLSRGLVCGEMKKVTPERILRCLEHGEGRVVLNEDIRRRAMLPIQRMLELE